MNGEEQRKALGDFLKTRRARLMPSSLGLPEGSRRRTPGLRREEVAQLASVSVTWYTWLEQGRNIKVSEQVLESIATALRLDQDERNHIHRLVRADAPIDQVPTPEMLFPTLRTVVDNLRCGPAWVIDHKWRILVWNEAASEVFGEFGAIPLEKRNILWFTYTDQTLRQRLVNWKDYAQSMLATFRASCGSYVGAPWFTRLVSDLKSDSPEFREWWSQHHVRETPIRHIKVDHPKAGLLELDNISFQVMNNPELRMCVYAATLESYTAHQIQQLTNHSVGCGRL